MLFRQLPRLLVRPTQRSWYARRSYAKASILGEQFLHLRQVFDDQKYFQRFSKTNGDRTGLFRNEFLLTPTGLIDFLKDSLVRARALVSEMLNEARTSEHGRLVYIRKLDQLSDLLCRVIDVAEFIRATHPSNLWVHAAQQTHEIMFEYMNQLNTNVELYQHLRNILEDELIVSKLTVEEVQVGNYLKQDFERSGIHMDPITRHNFVNINQEISLLGSSFNNESQSYKSYWCELEKHEFDQIPTPYLKKQILAYQKQFKKDDKKIHVVLAGDIPYVLLTCPVELVRRKIWLALHSCPEEQIQTLDGFVQKRAELARMLGYPSFAHYLLEHKMAKNPENVITFLTNLQESLKHKGVLVELKKLAQHKEGAPATFESDDELFDFVKPWDRDYLLSKLQESEEPEVLEPINEFLSVGTIIAGLSKLFSHLYNVEFIPVATSKGETWEENQVRKLQVYDHTKQKTLGYLYIDFWSNKVLPSHFTIVCSRRINENSEVLRKQVQTEDSYQLPVVSLICNFAKNNDSGIIGRFAGKDKAKPTFLTLDEVDTIFHEVGHAMHSMIGQTELHNLSGTRGSTDFVELPSVLMESFSKDPRVLCEIAHHYESNIPLDASLLQKHRERLVILSNCELFMQSKMAVLDQVLHGESIVHQLDQGIPIHLTEEYHKLEAELKIFADKWSTWHGKFPHLFSYAAVYYSYLFDRVMAEQIWKGLFEQDPWSREAGTKYKENVLKWGGTRDPWLCLADALGIEELAKGDLRAIEIISRDV